MTALAPLAAALAVLTAAQPVASETAGPVALPSGNAVTLQDIVTTVPGPAGVTYRFRFVAEWLTPQTPFDTTGRDILFLCESFALPRLPAMGVAPAQIVISVSSRAVAFGASRPDAVQLFEAFQPAGDTCIWQMF